MVDNQCMHKGPSMNIQWTCTNQLMNHISLNLIGLQMYPNKLENRAKCNTARSSVPSLGPWSVLSLWGWSCMSSYVTRKLCHLSCFLCCNNFHFHLIYWKLQEGVMSGALKSSYFKLWTGYHGCRHSRDSGITGYSGVIVHHLINKRVHNLKLSTWSHLSNRSWSLSLPLPLPLPQCNLKMHL